MAVSVPAILRNPIFEKDFVLFCRTKRWFFLRTVFVGSVMGAVSVFLLNSLPDIRNNNLDVVGRNLFAAAAFSQLIAVAALGPPMLADLIARERRTGTLSLLLVTPLSASGIVVGKLLSRLALLLTVVASSFPAVSIAMLFGGVRGEQVLALFILAVGVATYVSAVALLFSAFSRHAAISTLLGYLAAFLPAAAFAIDFSPSLSWLAGAIAIASPRGASVAPLPAAGAFLLTAVLSALGCMLVAVLRLRRERCGDAAGGLRQKLRAATFKPASYDRRNPMVIREARMLRGGIGPGSFRVVFVLLLLTEAGFVLSPDRWHGSLSAACDPDAALVTFQAFIVLLYATLAGATSVILDRERGAMDLLRLSSLSPRDVVVGKMFGTFRASIPLGVIPLAHLLLALPRSPGALVAAGAFVVVLSALTLLSAQLGVANSIQAGDVARAIRRSAWHFSWFTLGVPVIFALLTVLQTGQVDWTPAGFTLLAPLYITGHAAVHGSLSGLATFPAVAYAAAILILLVGTWLIHFPSYARSLDASRMDRMSALAQWQDSWKKLTAEWEDDA